MDFTEAEARRKIGKHVRVRDDSFESFGVQKGTHGRVVGVCHPGDVEVAVNKELWAVNISFGPENILVECIGKEEYEQSLQEGDFN